MQWTTLMLQKQPVCQEDLYIKGAGGFTKPHKCYSSFICLYLEQYKPFVVKLLG